LSPASSHTSGRCGQFRTRVLSAHIFGK
jgi:hypothetical protein